MPWLSILMAILSFFLSKKSGKTTAASALVGAAAGVGTYFLADPSNPDNLFKIGVDSTETAATDAPSASDLPTTVTGSIADMYGKTVDATGKVLTSWGPTGTAAVVGTTALATNSSLSKYLPWILGGAVFLLLSK